jgi:hypothetical protein
MDEQPCDFSSSPFDAANGFLSGASAIFLPTAFAARHRFFRAAVAPGIERPS